MSTPWWTVTVSAEKEGEEPRFNKVDGAKPESRSSIAKRVAGLTGKQAYDLATHGVCTYEEAGWKITVTLSAPRTL